MRFSPFLAALWLAAALPAQSNLGLTLNGTGTRCGTVTCTPATATVQPGSTAQAAFYSWPGHFFALGMALAPSGCLSIPGIRNPLLLQPPIATIAVGTVSNAGVLGICPQGSAMVPIAIPPQLPLGLQFVLQGFGFDQRSPRGPVAPAFSPAVLATVR